MTIDEKKAKCTEFFEKLSEALKEDYVVMGSCNQDFSRYLVPVGTESQVSYMEKPENSFRISDHWNWFANVNKCPDEHYIQCLSVDLPWARTDTRAFHEFIYHKAEVRFIKGRLHFGGSKNSAPFPSMIVVFGKGY